MSSPTMSSSSLGASQVDLDDIGLSDDISNIDNDPTSKLDAQDDVQNSMQNQEQLEKDMEVQRRKMIDPQLKQLRTSMQSIDQEVLQGQNAIKNSTRSNNNLDRQVMQANSSINQLDKSL